MRIFETALGASRDEGPAPLDLEEASSADLPPMDDPITHEQLAHIGALWSAFEPKLVSFLEEPEAEKLPALAGENAALLHEMDRAVTLMQRTADQTTEQLSMIGSVFLLLVILSLAAIAWRRATEVRRARVQISQLERLLPICARCKSIRLPERPYEQADSWVSVEHYFHDTTHVDFSHGLCPKCAHNSLPDIPVGHDRSSG